MIRDMANSLLCLLGSTDRIADGVMVQCVGKHWVECFIKRHPHLKTHYSRQLAKQRVLCNSWPLLNEWFILLEDTIHEQGIQEADIYNMDKKGFMMGISGQAKVVVKAIEHNKFVTTDGNREWVSVIESICSNGNLLPSMIIFKGKVYMEK